MKAVIISTVCAALAATACGGGEDAARPKGSAAGEEVSPRDEGDVGERSAVAKGVDQPEKQAAPGVDGEVVAAGKQDAGAPDTGKIEITFGDENQVSGSFQVGSIRLELSGVKEGGNLRLWAHPPAQPAGEIRRGYLWGTVEGGVVRGAFAISGTGGVGPVRGSWNGVER